MRTIQFNVYQFDELPLPIQEKVLDNERYKVQEVLDEWDADEYRGALSAIEDAFGIKVYDWCVGYPGTYFRWRTTGDRFDDVMDDPKYLVRYLNEVEQHCRKGKYYSTGGHYDENGKYHYKQRYSRVMFERGYALTGTWTCAVADKFTGNYGWECVRKHYTIKDFIDEMLDEFFHRWECDSDNNSSDEVVKDHILTNEYEYTEKGVRYYS